MRHSPTEVQARRQRVAALYLEGHYQYAIARDVRISQQQVSHDLRAVRAAWLASAVRDFDAAKAEELAKIDHVEQEAFAAWERSKLESESTLQERIGERLRVSRRIEKHVGDPRWLQTILTCIERRSALLGLAAPTRFTIDWDALTDSQMERIANREPLLQVLSSEPAPPAPLAEA